MGINAMENQAYDPRESNANNVWGTIMVVLLAVVVIFAIGYGVKWAWDKFTVPAPVSAIIEKATSSDAVAGYRNYCVNGQCVKVKMCTAISDECGSMEQGPKADYGTGYHTSADGRTRPNPPAGWKWGGK
jgi:hypothetical protein